MAKWARIEAGVVREVIDFDPAGRFGPPLVFVRAPNGVREGQLYDAATRTFTDPPPPPAPAPHVTVQDLLEEVLDPANTTLAAVRAKLAARLQARGG